MDGSRVPGVSARRLPGVPSLLVDTEPLRVSPAFRRLWSGLAVSNIGAQLTVVAVGLQVYGITHATFQVGILGIVALVPLVVFGLYGGSIVDHYDRRKVALVSAVVSWSIILNNTPSISVQVRMMAVAAAAAAVTSFVLSFGRISVRASIRDTSATALDEVRGVLGMLRQSDDPSPDESAPRRPEPTLAAIPALLEETRALGLQVIASGDIATGSWRDARPVSAATQTAAYRIVQESLTNVRRHAEASAVTVEVRAEADAVVLRIENDGATPGPVDADRRRPAVWDHRATPSTEPGRGLLGMRERATALGGTLEAEPTEAGGFRVTARLPADLRRSRREETR